MDTNNKKLVLSSLKNTALVYLVISFLANRMSVFASFCAGLPFCLPVITKKDAPALQVIKQSLKLGIAGILLSVVFMLFTCSYSARGWLLPALAGFGLCCLYCALKSILSPRSLAAVRSIIVTGVLLLCFL